MTLEFSVPGWRTGSRRVPEHQRPKRRGAGFTTEAAQVHLERREGDSWVSLTANKAEAGELITELSGSTGPVHPGHPAAAGRVRQIPAGRG